MKGHIAFYLAVFATLFCFVQPVSAEQQPEMLVIMEEMPVQRGNGVLTRRVCGLISDDVTCGLMAEDELEALLEVYGDYEGVLIFTAAELDLLAVDGNGEVIGANPYISTDTEK